MAILEVADIRVRFGGNMAVDDVSLSAEAGQITGLIGPNGAGKTTLFNVITGLQAPTAGRVVVDGTDITGLAPYRRARLGLARTFQRLELFGLLTVRQNIEVAADIARRWASNGRSAAAVAAELIERVGLGPVADVRADNLPTGQARLVELGRALATRPKIVLLDEPASGQDERETAHFAQLLKELAIGGMAVVLVEHDIHLVMDVCQHIHVLDFGRLAASGSPEEIRANEAVLAAYLGASWSATR